MTTLIDTGPIVALFNKRDQYHRWARSRIAQLQRPFYACEAVLTEAFFLLQDVPVGNQRLISLIDSGRLDLSFSYADHLERVNDLMRTYENIPMSFADACLVRMAEIHRSSRVFTTDDDFRIYRKHGDAPINVLMP